MSHRLQAVHHRIAQINCSWRAWIATLTGAKLGDGVLIETDCEVALGPAPARRGTLILGPHTRIARGVLLHPYNGRIALGSHVYLGPFTTIYGHGGVEIGNDTLIAMHCRILSSNHEISPPGTAIRSRPDQLAPTRIGRDVWLGAGVTVLAGVTIGDGCVVGAGAVVTVDLPAHSVACGIPARVIRRR